MDSSSANRDPLELLADDFLERRRRGESPNVQEYLEKHPDLAEQIQDLFPTLQLMEEAAPATVELKAGSGSTVSDHGLRKLEQVGDYRILREIGRGAMGVVYEAEQQSLGRRVALKVLPRQFSTEPKALVRFQNEARAAARLHHTNIVPVFEVGQDGDTLFYAMQYIQGQSLDKVLAELRRIRDGNLTVTTDKSGNTEAQTAAWSLCCGKFGAPSELRGTMQEAAASAALDGAKIEAGPIAEQSSKAPVSSLTAPVDSHSGVQSGLPTYFCSVAQIGEQAASALSYAHERNTVHRDIKPSNLLLDTNGILWLADFGLAKFQDDGHTRTGDLLGTLRYMSPERFQGHCDARADVYSLGVTLYEMLLLRPAFTSLNQLEVMDQISNLEPRRPRAIDPRIPRDLETIIMKAMEKEPAKRYPSARAMEEDLRHFIEDEPIQARKASPAERFVRWTRRNRLVATLTTASFALLTMLVVVSAAFAVHTKGANQNLEEAVKTAETKETTAQRAKLAAEQAKTELQSRVYELRMNAAFQAWQDGNLQRLKELLDLCRPTQGNSNQSAFAWRLLQARYQDELPAKRVPLDAGLIKIASSPDGKYLALSLVNGAIELYQWESERDRLRLMDADEHYAGASFERPACFSSDSRWLLAGGGGSFIGRELASPANVGRLHLWELSSQKMTLLPLTHERTVCGVAISPDGKLGASLSYDGVLKVWTFPEGKLKWENKGNRCEWSYLAFSPDVGSCLLATGGPRNVFLWDSETGNLRDSPQTDSQVNALAFSHDGKLLATSDSTEIRLWTVQSGKLTKGEKVSWERARDLVFSPDNVVLAAAGMDNRMVKLWDIRRGVQVGRCIHGGWMDGVAFRADGQWLASTSRTDGEARLWNLKAMNRRQCGASPMNRPALTVSSDNRTVAASGKGNTVLLWDTVTGESRTIPGHESMVVSVAFSDLGQKLASADKTTVRVWDIVNPKSPKLVQSFSGTSLSVVTMSSDGQWLAFGNETGDITLKNLKTGKSSDLKGGGIVQAIRFSRDGHYLAISAGAMVVWSLENGVPTQVAINGWGGQVVSFTFSPNGRTLAVPGDGHVVLWDWETNRQRMLPIGGLHPGATAFSPDGATLVAVAVTGEVKFWSTDSGEELGTMRMAEGVRNVAIFPDGNAMVTASVEGTLRVWRVAPLEDVH